MTLASRRRFLAAVASGACAAPWAAVARPAGPSAPWGAIAGGAAGSDDGQPRALAFEHLHTGEKLRLEYHDGQRYLPDALAAVDRLLRDFRSGDVAPIDPSLLDLLHTLRLRTGSQRAFEVISGYRSPATNALLRSRSDGVASGSLHLKGQAIDIRLADVALAQLRDAALSLHGGGVGYYAASNFVHVDTGRPRAW